MAARRTLALAPVEARAKVQAIADSAGAGGLQGSLGAPGVLPAVQVSTVQQVANRSKGIPHAISCHLQQLKASRAPASVSP